MVFSKVIYYPGYFAIKYLMSKQDTKPRLIRWILLLQEFDVEIRDKKGFENLIHIVGEQFSTSKPTI